MMSYLLDTNAWIQYLKNPASQIRSKLSSLHAIEIVTCSIVRSDLLHGAEKYGNVARRVSIVQQTLPRLFQCHSTTWMQSSMQNFVMP